MLTVLAAFDMTTELGCSANFDRLHYAPLNPIDVASIGTAPRLAVAAEDVSYFQSRPKHALPPLPQQGDAAATSGSHARENAARHGAPGP